MVWCQTNPLIHIPRVYCKTAVSPLLTHWRYCSLALSHGYDLPDHYRDVIMGASDGVSNHQPHACLLNRLFRRRTKRKHQSSASLAFMRGIHRRTGNSRPKWPVIWIFFHLMTLSCLAELIHWGRDKMAAISRRHFQMYFLEWKCINFD